MEERVTVRLEFECGHTVERTMLMKHRGQFLHVGRPIKCPVHDVMEPLKGIEDVRFHSV